MNNVHPRALPGTPVQDIRLSGTRAEAVRERFFAWAKPHSLTEPALA